MQNKTAYDQGVAAALEKFALVQGGGVMRAAAPNVTKRVAKKMTYAPAAGHMAPGQAAATAAANPALAGKPQGLLSKAWGGLNAIAANPVGQMGLMMGVPAVMNMMSSPSQEKA